MPNKLVVGLGNPGKKYSKTRHNLGFVVLDALAQAYGAKFELKKKLESEIAEMNHNSSWPPLKVREGEDELLILAKPQNFMNDSGKAVSQILGYRKIPISDLLVIHDESDLPFGKIRLSSGGAAGHKGVESIIAAVGNGFVRLRIGIENRSMYRVPDTEAYVLQNFMAEEMKKLKKEIIPKAIEEIGKFLISN